MDNEALLATIAKTTRRFIEEFFAPFKTRLDRVEGTVRSFPAALEARLLELPTPISAEEIAASLREMVEDAVDRALARLPKPKDGEPGAPGKDAAPVDYGLIDEEIAGRVRVAVELLPKPKDGAPGRDAAPVDYRKLEEALDDLVAERLADLPAPKDGAPGKDAVVDYGAVFVRLQEMVAALPRPRDGRDALDPAQLHDAIERYAGEFFASVLFERREIDARSFVDLITFPSGRTIELARSAPAMIYRGVWREGTEYERGDTVTRSGSLWHCNAERTSVPPGDRPEWTLAAKRGADGRDAGEPRRPPPPAVLSLR